MKRMIITGVAVAVTFTACNMEGDPIGSIHSAIASHEQIPEITGEQLPQQQEDQLLSDIALFENYCAGKPFSQTSQLEDSELEKFMLGWLSENGLMERYAVYSGSSIYYYSIPPEDIKAFYKAYFAVENLELPEENVQYSVEQATAQPMVLDIEKEGVYQLSDGSWQIDVRRYCDGQEWYPASYRFYLQEDSDLPKQLQAQPNQSAVFCFISAENRELEEDKSVVAQFVEISTPQQLVELSDLVNNGDYSYLNNVYTLTADLDMQGVAIQPIGNTQNDARSPAPYGFCSTFDGRGHTIKNLTITESEVPAGLFSVVGSQGFVNNLKLENCSISAAEQEIDGVFIPAGGVAGIVHDGVVSRCTITGNVSATQNAGGIAGVVSGYSNVQKCLSYATVTGSRQIGCAFGATISGRIDECSALGEVYAISKSGTELWAVGGFTGLNEKAVIDRGIASARLDIQENMEAAGLFAGENTGNLAGCFYNSDLLDAFSPVGISEPIAVGEHLIGFTQKELAEMGVLD